MFLLTACGNSETAKSPEKIAIGGMHYVDPLEQTEKYVGIIDNLFIAEVVKYEETFQLKPDDAPYRNLRIKITENIKGKLELGKEVLIIVEGGITDDGKYEYEGAASQLTPGTTYLFSAWIQSEKSVLPTDSILAELAIDLPADYKTTETCSKWTKAYENELPRDKWESVEGKD